MNEWIDTKNCVPLIDGDYLIQTIYGKVYPMQYTAEGGWNTHRDSNGQLYDENAINDGYVARWFNPVPPKSIPDEWLNEYMAQ